MWKLKHVSATNFVSFKDLDLELTQGVTTLLYGVNMDNENQKNNGTGKSSLLEIIAFGITGESIKKVPNINDIINNYEEEASVHLTFVNDYDSREFRIERYISRSQPQRIELFERVDGDGKEKAIVLSSVLEYGKYILDELGVTKDEIYGCFLLNNARFKSFFVASDKEKKDIINNFSNGVVVDEAIDKLHTDMEPVEQQLNEAKLDVAKAQGAVEAIATQIDVAMSNQQTEADNREQRINGLKEQIADKRSEIQTTQERISLSEERLEVLNSVKDQLTKLKESQVSASEGYRKIKDLFEDNKIPAIEDYDLRVAEMHGKINAVQEKLTEAKQDLAERQEKQAAFQAKYDEIRDAYTKLKADTDSKTPDIDKKIKHLNTVMDNIETVLAECDANVNAYKNTINALDDAIIKLNIKLQGSVTCPNCGFKFAVEADGAALSASDIMLQIEDREKAKTHQLESIKEIKEKISQMEANFDKYDLQIVDLKKDKKVLQESLDAEHAKLTDAKYGLEELADDTTAAVRKVDLLERDYNSYVAEVDNMSYKMFSQAFTNIDKSISDGNVYVERLKASIASDEAAIEVIKSSIEDIKNFDAAGVVDQLKARQQELMEHLEGVKSIESSRQRRYDELVAQEDYFVRFKSYLANTKIDSIADLTNSFLQQIGSDMNIELSGYKMLKSKKIREKITVSILRNGEDGGAFEKFSCGERCRIVLAGILAMRQLTNANCEDGKGLDLLILDEILDASDYPGLMSYADAINSLGITTLMITQNVVNEQYPYRLEVRKENGVSTIINKQ